MPKSMSFIPHDKTELFEIPRLVLSERSFGFQSQYFDGLDYVILSIVFFTRLLYQIKSPGGMSADIAWVLQMLSHGWFGYQNKQEQIMRCLCKIRRRRFLPKKQSTSYFLR